MNEHSPRERRNEQQREVEDDITEIKVHIIIEKALDQYDEEWESYWTRQLTGRSVEESGVTLKEALNKITDEEKIPDIIR